MGVEGRRGVGKDTEPWEREGVKQGRGRLVQGVSWIRGHGEGRKEVR